MNTHFQTYSNLSSPHSPSPDDNIRYTSLPPSSSSSSSGAAAAAAAASSLSGGGGLGSGPSPTTTTTPSITTTPSTAAATLAGHPGGHHTTTNNTNGNLTAINGVGNIAGGNCNGNNNNNNNNMVVHQNHHQHQHQQQQQHHHHQLQQQQHQHQQQQNGHHHHEHHHHHQNMQMDNDQPNFHHLNNNNHHNNNSPIKYCSGCGGKIAERYYLHALDRYWHNSCLKCYTCGALLADIGSSCYTREGMILCKADYIRMFGKAACSACGQIIAANEFVMRTTSPLTQQQQQSATDSPKFQNQIEHHVFHLKCFACSKCSSQLRPGDKYYMLAGSLVCEQDWHKLLLKNSTTTTTAPANPPVRKGKVGRPRRSRD